MRSFILWSVLFLLVACSKVPILISESQEKELGEQAYQEVLQKSEISTNPRWNALVDRVGQRIAKVANKPSYQWEFRVLDSSEKNAFCLPGGKVAVYTGILPLARNEAGLATILGHEVAHATLRHAAQRITVLFAEELGFTALQAILAGQVSPSQQKLLMGALGLASIVGISLPFSRAQESQADAVGLRYMAAAGYDPNAAPHFWERMERLEKHGPPAFLSDHPASESRRRALIRELPRVMPLYNRSARYGTGSRIAGERDD